MRSFIAALCVAAAAASVPTFPQDWQAIVTDSILLNQGGIANPDGSVCCEPNAPQCKIQTAYQAGRQFFAYSKKLTAFKAPDNSGIVTDYTAGKEYQVDSTGACQAYCPLPHRDSELYPFAIDPNATLIGTQPCGSQSCQHYEMREEIPILNITMEVTDYFIGQQGGAPAPVYIVQHIEPLGEQIGDENQTFADWQDMDGKAFPASAFTVNGAASCPQAQQCQGDDDGQGNNDMPADLADSFFLRYGVAIPGENRRSVLFAQAAAIYNARVAAAEAFKKLSPALEDALSKVPTHLQARARALLAAREA